MPNMLLTKTRFLSGLQCHKRLWLETNQPQLKMGLSPVEEARIATGKRMDELARKRFPQGILLDISSSEVDNTVWTTQEVISHGEIKAIFQPTFRHENILVRNDILERTPVGWNLIEVKSTGSLKDEHVPDLAFQLYVLERNGIAVDKTFVMHLNTDYAFDGGEYDIEHLFSVTDATEDVKETLKSIPRHIAEMQMVMEATSAPCMDVGKQCKEPSACPFHAYCNSAPVANPITELPRLRPAQRERFAADGIATIDKIPRDYPGLSALQKRVRDSVISGQPYFNPKLREYFKALIFPLYFLDFETVAPVLPLFLDTHPYQSLAFQWSLHILDASNHLTHHEFLAQGNEDPRFAFVESLLAKIGNRGTIMVYSSYEATISRGLIAIFPDLELPLQKILSRLFDLLPIIRENVYHPEFHGSFSIKKVLPALVLNANYDDLDIRDGSTAGAMFTQSISNKTSAKEKEKIRHDLLKYCERDTLAMVKLYEVLCEVNK
jgi:predicted RecB family nuclease